MKTTYIIGDLLLYGERQYIAHCISEDLALGAGIAKKINKKFKVKKDFTFMGITKYPIGRCVKTNTVFNLVTKCRFNDKPRVEDLLRALTDMKYQMKMSGITKLYIPTIGCGLDRLKWDCVYSVIERVFCYEDIDIVVVLPDKVSCVTHGITNIVGGRIIYV